MPSAAIVSVMSSLVKRIASIIKETVLRFVGDQMLDAAAALTYYALLSLVPGLLMASAVLTLLGTPQTVTDFGTYLTDHGAPAEVVNTVATSLDAMMKTRLSSAGLTLVVAILISLYAASGAFGAAGRALNVVQRNHADLGFVRRKLADLGATLLITALAVIALIFVFVGGGLAEDLFALIGLDASASGIWDAVRQFLAVAVVMLIYAFVYWAAPKSSSRRFKLISPGAVVGVVIWIAASLGFSAYISNFDTYSAAYGLFGAVIILLIWLWLSNVALLIGAELNAVLEERKKQRSLRPDGDQA